MNEDEAESFRLWGGLLLLAKQDPGGSAAWAVNEIKRLNDTIARLQGYIETLKASASSAVVNELNDEIARLQQELSAARTVRDANMKMLFAKIEQLENAIAVERERCAMVAAMFGPAVSPELKQVVYAIAAAIRKGE